MDLVVRRVKERASCSSAVAGLANLGLTDEQLSDEILTMILAGYHTTGSSAAWLVYFLATQPEYAAEIAKEAAEISDGGGEIRPERLVHAGKSLAFAREVLRLYPSSHWFSRDVQADVEIGGERLKRGDAILISPWHMHRDPRYWDAPEQFNPERDFVASPAFIPFGAGPRACVGMGLVMVELQLMALEFASSFDVKLISSEPIGMPRPAITLLPPPIELSLQVKGALRPTSRMAA
jgi:cytochrome P450